MNVSRETSLEAPLGTPKSLREVPLNRSPSRKRAARESVEARVIVSRETLIEGLPGSSTDLESRRSIDPRV